jgi:mRNA interferase HigB
MRLIASSTLAEYSEKHPETAAALAHWRNVTKASRWESMAEVQSAFPKAKVLNYERVRFEVAGGNYRLIAAFDFQRQIVFVKFIGTHAEYDSIDAKTIAKF